MKYLVQNFQNYVNLQGCNISFDRLYTSVSLTQWLLSQNITSVGTLQSNRRGMANEIKNVAERERFSDQCFWESSENKLVLHSHVVPTKSSGKRNVLLLSAVQPILGVTKDDGKKKPAIYKLYDFTKDGTDVMDHRIGADTCKAKSNLWTLTAFSYILDVWRINASTVFAFNKKMDPCKHDSYDLGINLAFSLIRPQIQRRPLAGLQVNVKKKMSLLLGEEVEANRYQQTMASETEMSLQELHPKKCAKSLRCKQCINQTAKPGNRKKVQNMSKSKNQCHICLLATCSDYTVQMCMQCYKSSQLRNLQQ